MPIQEITSAGPTLHHLGIHVQTAQPAGDAAAASPNETATPAAIDQQERLTLAGLQLNHFEQAYLVVPGVRDTPLVIDPSRFNSTPLVQSLQQVGRRLDLDTALDLHAAASSLIAAMRQSHELPAEGPVKLVLAGAFGEIELDLDRLQPEALRSAFSSGLEEQPRGQLQQIHSQLSSLSQLVRAGFEADEAGVVAQNWLAAVMAPGFQPGAFFEQSQGFSPLNQESSVRQLLQSVQSAPVSESQSESPSQTQAQADARALSQLLEEKSQALIDAANRLEEQLELAPTPDAPDIMDLLRAFLAILRQLDLDISKLLKQQSQLKQFEHKLLAQFAERLHRNLNFQQSQLDGLRESRNERMKLLVSQAQTQLQSKIWLLQASMS
ncbi:MAG TPA: hypothetical protein V6D23_21830 [Candidatus Obscuribacterales bacterium]